MKPFEELLVWRDPLLRNGPDCMAVDELLLRKLGERAVLRLYRWSGDWVSVGYFGHAEAAQERYGDQVSVVRRWTGGGTVDHRDDLTYSLMIPRIHPVSQRRGAESYQVIHQAVAEALKELGYEAKLVTVDSEESSDQCFEKPVAWDVVDVSGKKLAGAGQRRTRWGLLHQGSVQVDEKDDFGKSLSEKLADRAHSWEPPPAIFDELPALVVEKYSTCQQLASGRDRDAL